MNISANTLFHFTHDYDTLLSILKTKFYPRLCLENLQLTDRFVHRIAIPMVCFCDIPLSQISDHITKYGSYAIGIKKTRAIQQGVTPVLYYHKNSIIRKAIAEQMNRLLSASNDNIIHEEDTSLFEAFLQCFFMIKPYEGEQLIDGKKRRIRFYDEREWRYIPPISLFEENSSDIFLSEKEYNDIERRARLNSHNEQYGVLFSPEEINYIIVKNTDEILPLKRELSKIKGGFSHDSVELLETKLMSMEQINEDF